uniref:Uncharacterized protein n=1 Tax=Human herpesvirus 2 TaxID=10310 RepID=A0A481TWS9_HHV2|nr:hypothetical protein [Human alphaherpesvirus 2]
MKFCPFFRPALRHLSTPPPPKKTTTNSQMDGCDNKALLLFNQRRVLRV